LAVKPIPLKLFFRRGIQKLLYSIIIEVYKAIIQTAIYIQTQHKHTGTIVAGVARELDVTTATIYNYVTPNGELTDRGNKMLLTNKKS